MVNPSKSRFFGSCVHSVKTFPVILEAPHSFPKGVVITGDHAAFAACCHDLVLTEGPGGNISESANGATPIERSMGLCTIFDKLDIAACNDLFDRIHVTWPACKMDADDCLGSVGNGLSYCRGFDVLAIRPDIDKNGGCAGIDNH